MRTHYRKKYAECKRPKGRPPKALGGVAPRWEEVLCQRLFVLGTGSHFFAVISPAEIQEEKEARQRREMALTLKVVILDNATQTEVSPWLEMTQWPKYLHGHSFSEVALLAAPVDPTSESLLVEFSESLDRIIEEAQDSIRNDKVNVFGQARINSFIQKRRAWDRPLMIKLQNSTHREYKQVFQRLIFFAFRTVQPEQKINLSHRLTTSQLRHLDQMMGYGEELLPLKDGRQQNGTQKDTQSQLDRACLLFCIAVLDHTLKGGLFESVTVGFLAVLGVDPAKKIFRDASSFTSYLSTFVKISQMLVLKYGREEEE
ncbi:hypothetical protein BS50DRAFT_604116 [Corynespora cassiicola Philippines]|uniref:Uncharacterized protein n=1 Tax=Corynespora cassiicola Philippines TaxID=1448308 RepID=A0A2T2N829_CORCC|nr:hypothetical protein BS50DRAFT_604116 [Corynespora cassiicola Philippines]